VYHFVLPDFVLTTVVGDVKEKRGREGGREGLLEVVGVVGYGRENAWRMVVPRLLPENARRRGGRWWPEGFRGHKK